MRSPNRQRDFRKEQDCARIGSRKYRGDIIWIPFDSICIYVEWEIVRRVYRSVRDIILCRNESTAKTKSESRKYLFVIKNKEQVPLLSFTAMAPYSIIIPRLSYRIQVTYKREGFCRDPEKICIGDEINRKGMTSSVSLDFYNITAVVNLQSLLIFVTKKSK